MLKEQIMHGMWHVERALQSAVKHVLEKKRPESARSLTQQIAEVRNAVRILAMEREERRHFRSNMETSQPGMPELASEWASLEIRLCSSHGARPGFRRHVREGFFDDMFLELLKLVDVNPRMYTLSHRLERRRTLEIIEQGIGRWLCMHIPVHHESESAHGRPESVAGGPRREDDTRSVVSHAPSHVSRVSTLLSRHSSTHSRRDPFGFREREHDETHRLHGQRPMTEDRHTSENEGPRQGLTITIPG